MPKAVLLTIDDDPEVLKAVERDLRRQYGEKYRVLSAGSGQSALDLLDKLRQRGESVALFLADYRMPQMSGIEFLSRAMSTFPDAKRVLLTAYADTEAAIRAINEVKLNHYLLKPWDPPEQNLYPVLDDLLDDWQASYRAPFEGLQILGTRWSPRSYELREFLARNQVPYHWLDVESADRDPEVRRALDMLAPAEQQFPVVLFPDGSRLPDPSHSQVAGHIGLQTRAVIMNEPLARGLGISSSRVRFMTFCTGAALASAAGALITPLSSVDPNMGVPWIVGAFMLVLVSGSSLLSLGLASLVLGGAQVLVSTFVNPVLGGLTIAVLAALLLRLRPEGFARG